MSKEKNKLKWHRYKGYVVILLCSLTLCWKKKKIVLYKIFNGITQAYIKNEAAVNVWPYIFQAYRFWVFSQAHIQKIKSPPRLSAFIFKCFYYPNTSWGNINTFTAAVIDSKWTTCNFSSLVSITELPCLSSISPWEHGWWKGSKQTEFC